MPRSSDAPAESGWWCRRSMRGDWRGGTGTSWPASVKRQRDKRLADQNAGYVGILIRLTKRGGYGAREYARSTLYVVYTF